MADDKSRVFFPSVFQELFSLWDRLDDAVLYAGGTGHLRSKSPSTAPQNIISLDKLEELKTISRTERYIEIGAMVTLNRIIQLGKIVPEALIRCLESLGGPQLRNIATIGGNICYPFKRLDSIGPMIALDAQYELRSAETSRWISASKFSSPLGPPALEPNELLTRIRVPLEPWSFVWYRKFITHGRDKPGNNIILLLRYHKNILTGIRVVYSGQVVLREKNSENMLAGKRLPLDQKNVAVFMDSWKNYLSGLSEMESVILASEAGNFKPELVKTQILKFIEATIMRISE